jgi:hypothetical protein
MTVAPACSGLFLAFVLVASSAAGGQQAGFSGRWTRVEPPLSADSVDTQRIEVDGSVLKLHIEQRGTAGSLGYGFTDDRTYAIDGPIESKKDDDGRIRTVAVHREGPDLVFVRTTTEGLNVTTEREVWSISADGSTLTKASETTDWRGTRTGRRVYQRAPEKRPPHA